MSGPIVQVKQGKLRGAVVENVDGGSYISFRGIPYAEPPVGDLRFQETQPPKSWNGVRDALKEGPSCAQVNLITKRFKGEEDCLYLNISTTSLDESRPVMVWIHGGGFLMGSGNADTYGPDYLIKKDIVYVSINYRLGCLGFLNLELEEAPGNQGLKDQLAALKWVKENIAAFGGDPNNITIFGQSAGGASVHYLTLSPLAKGLFHKAIAQSGLVNNPWAFKTETRSTGYRLAAALGMETSNPQEALSFLRSVSPRKLAETEQQLLSLIEKFKIGFPFGPSIDGKSKQPFLPCPPMELAREGVDVPFILGYVADEGVIFNSKNNENTYSLMDKYFESIVLPGFTAKAPADISVIAKKIRKLYFGDETITEKHRNNYIEYAGHVQFINGIHEICAIQAKKKSPTYLYRFSFQGPMSLAPLWYSIDEPATVHGDDLVYLFRRVATFGNAKLEPGTPERIVLDRLTQMWTNFAKIGTPTPMVDNLITAKWLPLTSSTKNYLEIGEHLVAGMSPDSEKWDAWQRIYDTV